MAQAKKKPQSAEKSIDAILKRCVDGKWVGEKWSKKNLDDAAKSLKNTMKVLRRMGVR